MNDKFVANRIQIVNINGVDLHIGDECIISPDLQTRKYHYNNNTIFIDKNVQIENNVTILAGVSIGQGAIILKNSFVRFNVKPYTMVSGNPAQLVALVEKPSQVFNWNRTINKQLIQPQSWYRTKDKQQYKQVHWKRTKDKIHLI